MLVRVRIPATTANLGPGFDALGLALGLYDEILAETADADEVVVSTSGPGGGSSGASGPGGAGAPPAVPTNARNLALRAASAAYPGAHFRLRLNLAIPVGRGLGSSAAAVVGGLVAGSALAGRGIDPAGLLPLATEIEGHPDNVAPALFGGLCAVCASEGRVWAVRLDPPPLWAAVAIPFRPLPTAQARRVLPRQVPFADAVANVQRTALLVAACAAGRWDVLGEATQDRLHQPYRAPLVPGLAAALAAARGAGALAAFLSGAGPTALALAVDAGGARVSAEAMCAALAREGVASEARVLPLERGGATVESD